MLNTHAKQNFVSPKKYCYTKSSNVDLPVLLHWSYCLYMSLHVRHIQFAVFSICQLYIHVNLLRVLWLADKKLKTPLVWKLINSEWDHTKKNEKVGFNLKVTSTKINVNCLTSKFCGGILLPRVASWHKESFSVILILISKGNFELSHPISLFSP